MPSSTAPTRGRSALPSIRARCAPDNSPFTRGDHDASAARPPPGRPDGAVNGAMGRADTQGRRPRSGRPPLGSDASPGRLMSRPIGLRQVGVSGALASRPAIGSQDPDLRRLGLGVTLTRSCGAWRLTQRVRAGGARLWGARNPGRIATRATSYRGSSVLGNWTIPRIASSSQ